MGGSRGNNIEAAVELILAKSSQAPAFEDQPPTRLVFDLSLALLRA